MNFRTEVFPEKPQRFIEHKHVLMFMGSCFAQHMGNAFVDAGFRTLVNPFGVVFNPSSVATSLRFAVENRKFTERDLIFSGNLWHSWYHHGSFAKPDAAELLDTINADLLKTATFLHQADYLFVTLGTAWVFRHKTLGEIVTNCHKVPGSEFDRFRLTVADIVAEWKLLIAQLKAFNPKLTIVFTVSPVRHLADGAHGNQLSKSALLLAVNELCESSDCLYFPAYELLLDDLRDYRYFDADMVHPSAMAVEYIREKLFLAWLSPKSQQLASEVQKLRKSLLHRPLHGITPEWEAFRKTIDEKIEMLKRENPDITI